MTTPLSEKIIKKIEKDCIQPKPRWRFLVKDVALWVSGIIALAVGSVAVSVVIFVLVNNDWVIARAINASVWGGILTSIPFLWLISFIAFAWIAHYNVCHTKRGYQFHTFILLIVIATPIIFGYALYRVGASHFAEALLDAYFPRYQTMLERKHAMWLHPQEGMLGGKVLQVTEDGECVIRDREGNIWEVHLNVDHQKIQKYIHEGDMVGVMGTPRGDDVFEAETVRVLDIHGGNKPLMEKFNEKFGEREGSVRGREVRRYERLERQ